MLLYVSPSPAVRRRRLHRVILSHLRMLTAAVNRLDRLTSGLMILALTTKAARDLSQEFMDKTIRKEYVARVKGKFPE